MRQTIIAVAFFAIIIASCDSISKNNTPNQNELNVKIKTTEISSGTDETLMLKSFIYDSCVIKNSRTIQTGVRKQELFFLKNGIQIRKQENPIENYTYTQSDCTDSLQVVECSIYEIGLIEGIKGKVFCIRGSGLDNASPELFAFYDLNGNCIWLNYSNQYKSFKSIGNYDSICNKIGIDTSSWLKGLYKKVSIIL